MTFASGTVTLTLTNTNASQTARNLRLNLTGTSGGAQDLIVPAIEKVYIINNGCADTITVKNSTGTGIAVPAGKTMYVYNDGTNVVDAVTHLTSLTLATALPVASGGTGSNTGTFSGANITSLNASSISSGTLDNARLGTVSVAKGGTGATTLTNNSVIIGNTTDAVKFVAPGTTGNVLTSNGTVWLSQAVAAAAGGLSASVGYDSPATFVAPPTTTKVYVMLGAGGGGGGGLGRLPGNQPFGARFGAAGATAFGVVSVTGGSPYAITVGAGGTAGATPNGPGSTGGNGNPGGASSFSNLISANGGGGGNGTGPGQGGSDGAVGNASVPGGGTGFAGGGSIPSYYNASPNRIGSFNSRSGGGSATIPTPSPEAPLPAQTIPATNGQAGYVFIMY